MSLQPFIIDCDTGRDDALTLWLAVKAALPLIGVVTSYGNVTVENVTDNTARVLSLVGANSIPIIAGLSCPQTNHRLFDSVVKTRQEASGNGLCNLVLPSSPRAPIPPLTPEDMAQKIRELARIHGILDYFIIGPASNFAAIAEVLGADLKKIIGRLTMMGGKFDPLWTEIPGADFNIASDPYAVDKAMRFGIPIRFVPLNATWSICRTLQDIQALKPTTALAKWAQDLMVAHCLYFAPEPVFRFHDPSVMIAAQMPGRFANKKLKLIVDESHMDFGRLIESDNGISCQVYETDETTRVTFERSILHWLEFKGF